MAVSFVVFRDLGENEKLYVCGDAPELGNWNPLEGLALKVSPPGSNRHFGKVHLPKRTILYKYVIADSSKPGSFLWEESPFIIRTVLPAAKSIMCEDGDFISTAEQAESLLAEDSANSDSASSDRGRKFVAGKTRIPPPSSASTNSASSPPAPTNGAASTSSTPSPRAYSSPDTAAPSSFAQPSKKLENIDEEDRFSMAVDGMESMFVSRKQPLASSAGNNNVKSTTAGGYTSTTTTTTTTTTNLTSRAGADGPPLTTVGLVLKQRKVDLVVEGGSAAISGRVHIGDEIVAVDGVPVNNSNVVQAMRGEVGSQVTITLSKASNGELMDVILTRQQLWGHGMTAQQKTVMQSFVTAFKSGDEEACTGIVSRLQGQIAGLENQVIAWKAEAELAKKQIDDIQQQHGASLFSTSTGTVGGAPPASLMSMSALASFSPSKYAGLSPDAASLAAQLDKLKKDFAAAQAERDQMNADKLHLKAQIRQEMRDLARQEMDHLNAEYNEKLEGVNKQLKQEQEKTATAEGRATEQARQLEALLADLQARDATLDLTNQSLSKQTAAFEHLKKETLVEIENLHVRLRAEQEKSQHLEAERNEANHREAAVSAQLAAVRQRTAAMEADRAALDKELADIKVRFAELTKRHEEGTLTSADRIARLEEELRLLRAQLDENGAISEEKLKKATVRVTELVVAKSSGEGRIEEQAKQISYLEKELRVAKEEIEATRKALAEAQAAAGEAIAIANERAAKAESELRGERDRYGAHLAQLEQQIKALDAHIKQLEADRSREVTALTERARDALTKLQSAESRVDELVKNTTQLTEEIRRLRQLLESAETNLAAARADLEQRDAALERLRAERDEAVARIKKLESSDRGLTEERRRADNLAAELAERTATCKQLEKQLNEALAELTRVREAAEENQRALETQIAAEQRALADARSTLGQRAAKAEEQYRNSETERARVVEASEAKLRTASARVSELVSNKGQADGRVEEAVATADRLRQENAGLTKLVKTLEAQLSEVREDATRLRSDAEASAAVEQERIATEDRRNRELNVELQRRIDALNAELESSRNNFKRDSKALSQQLLDTSAARDSAEARSEEQQARIEALCNELDGLRKKLAESEAQVASLSAQLGRSGTDLEKQLKVLREQLADATDRANAAEDRSESLAVQLKEAISVAADARPRIEIAQRDREDTLDSLDRRTKEWTEKQQRLDKLLNEERAARSAEVTELQEVVARLEARLKQAEGEHAAALQQANKQVTAAREQAADASSSLGSLKGRCEELTSQLEAARTAQHAAQLAKTAAESSAMTAETARRLAADEASRAEDRQRQAAERARGAEQRCSELSSQVSSLTAEVKNLRARLGENDRQQQADRAEAQRLQQAAAEHLARVEEQLQAEVRRLQGELSSAKELIARLQEQLRLAEDERSRNTKKFEEKLRSATARVTELVLQKGAAEGRVEEQSVQLVALQNEVKALTAARANAEAEASTARGEAERLAKELATTTKAQNELVAAEKDKAEAERKQARQQEAALREQIQNSDKDRASEVGTLQEQLRTALSGKAAAESQAEERERALNRADGDVRNLKSQLSASADALNAAQVAAGERENTVRTELNAIINNMGAEIEGLRNLEGRCEEQSKMINELQTQLLALRQAGGAQAELQATIARLEEQLKAARLERDRDAAAAEARIKELSAALQQQQQARGSAEGQVEELLKAVQQLQADIKQLRVALGAAENGGALARAEAERLSTECESKVSRLRTEVEAEQRRTNEYKELSVQLQHRMDEMRAQFEIDKREALTDLERKCENMTQNITDLTGKLNAAEQRVEYQTNQITSMQSVMKSQREALAEAEEALKNTSLVTWRESSTPAGSALV